MMRHISYYIRKFFQYHYKLWVIIHLHEQGFESSTEKMDFDFYAEHCWLPRDYDWTTDSDYAIKGEFICHIEIPKEYSICWN